MPRKLNEKFKIILITFSLFVIVLFFYQTKDFEKLSKTVNQVPMYSSYIIVSDRENHGFVEIDKEGNIVNNFNGTYLFEKDRRFDKSLDIERLSNGNTLIVYYTGNPLKDGITALSSIVAEINPAGELVWNYSGELLFVHDADKLPNGNILITDTGNDRVIEVTRTGYIVWEWKASYWVQHIENVTRFGEFVNSTTFGVLHYPNDVQRLPNGNTIISLRNHNAIIEVNRTGHILWMFGTEHASINATGHLTWGYGDGILKRPHNPDLLPNGNMVIADSENKRIIEINKETREIVWQFNDSKGIGLNWARDADRLPNNNTLIVDSRNQRLLEIDIQGNVLSEYNTSQLGLVYDADKIVWGYDIQLPVLSPLEEKYTSNYILISFWPEILPDVRFTNISYKIYDELNKKWIDDKPIQWTENVYRNLNNGKYILYPFAEGSSEIILVHFSIE